MSKYQDANAKYLLFLAEVSQRHYRFDDSIRFFKMGLEKGLTSENCGDILKRQYSEGTTVKQLVMDKVQLYFKSKIQVYRYILANLENFDETANSKMIQAQQKSCQQKMGALVRELFSIFDAHLLPLAQGLEDKIFLEKSKADYMRYLAEVDSDEAHKTASKKHQEAALALANELGKNTKTYLGLMLNQSVFLYNIMQSSAEAIKVAKETKDQWYANQSPEGQEIIEILENNLQDWEPRGDDIELNEV